MKNEEGIIISGPEGEIECLLNKGQTGFKKSIAIICHPHSLHGGSMDNKVVYIAARAFQENRYDTLRFNFRGVGKSTGEYAQGIGEQDDLIALIKWAANEGYGEVALGGFSFGSSVSAAVASQWQNKAIWANQLRELHLQCLVLIAPPVNHFEFDRLDGLQSAWLVVQGGEDEVVPCAEVASWVTSSETFTEKAYVTDFIVMGEAGHFFHGCLPELKQHITSFLQQL